MHERINMEITQKVYNVTMTGKLENIQTFHSKSEIYHAWSEWKIRERPQNIKPFYHQLSLREAVWPYSELFRDDILIL